MFQTKQLTRGVAAPKPLICLVYRWLKQGSVMTTLKQFILE